VRARRAQLRWLPDAPRAGAPNLAGLLFPVAARSPKSRPSLAGAYVTALVAIGAAALLRQSGLPATSTIWAEDGQIFYAQALRMSFWRTLVTLHDGYGQLFPRVVVQVARVAAPGQAAEILAGVGAFSLAGIACLVFHMARGHIASPALRALLVASIVLLPVASAELLDNVVNVPWWLFFASFWALLWRPYSTAGRAAAGLVCLLAAASEPLVGLFLPLSIARAIALPNARDQAPTVGIVSGLLYQVLVMVRSSGNIVSSAGSLQGLAQSFSVRVGLGLAGGEKGTDWLFVHERPIAVGLGAVVLCSLLAIAVFLGGSLRVRAFTLAAASFCVGCYVVPVWLRGLAPTMKIARVEVASRYQAVPVLLLVSTILVIADHWAKARTVTPQRWRSVMVVAVCACLLGPTWVVDFRDSNQRSAGPAWGAEVARATSQCRRTPTATVSLPIDPPGWNVSLRCGDLLTSRPPLARALDR
jgi:hypothetical protein